MNRNVCGCFYRWVYGELVKTFCGEKDLFTEGRATVCYSNYCVAGCRIFSSTHLECGKKTALVGIGLAETFKFTAALVVREESRVLFW